MMISPRSRADLLRAYFVSGWAFLLPYLLAYLLYAGLKWPVNFGAGGGNGERGTGSWIPCLLHVYWVLHGLHLLLGAIALRIWWKRGAREQEEGHKDNGDAPASGLPAPFSLLLKAAPWILLGLLFWIPGVYLEFPADPWQHYARTNEWSWHALVTEHSYWGKSSYFLSYSFVGRIAPALLQLKFFDLYYTACCLLLCWQYYRLARAVGLSERTSQLFVLLNVLTFGNNLFGFYRYYGMSSTVFAQLGAVALTRIAVELARGRKQEGLMEKEQTGSPSLLRSAFSLLPAALFLILLTAFNHVQGLGIAALGIAAVIVWRLVAWRKSMVIGLGLAALALSVATVLWFPRHPLIDSTYRPYGWMSPWYGLPLFQPRAPGFQLGWVIFGATGALNLLAALVLLWRNRIEGWLAVMPVLLLSLPVVAIPLATVLASSTDVGENGYLMAYPRMLFAIPMGMAICALVGELMGHSPRNGPIALPLLPMRRRQLGFPIVVGSLVLFTLLPTGGPALNRIFNVLLVPADDLAMRHVLGSPAASALRTKALTAASPSQLAEVAIENSQLLATPSTVYVLGAGGSLLAPNVEKNQVSSAAISAVEYAESSRTRGRTQQQTVLIRPREALFTAGSPTATLSRHWLSDSVALDHAAQSELASLPTVPRSPPQVWLQWYSPRDNTRIFAPGTAQDLGPESQNERGRLDSGIGNQIIRKGDRVVFQPVMRTFDGSGLALHFRIIGPGVESTGDVRSRPTLAGKPQWTYTDVPVAFNEVGRYDIELAATTLGGKSGWTVRYHLVVQPSANAASQ